MEDVISSQKFDFWCTRDGAQVSAITTQSFQECKICIDMFHYKSLKKATQQNFVNFILFPIGMPLQLSS